MCAHVGTGCSRQWVSSLTSILASNACCMAAHGVCAGLSVSSPDAVALGVLAPRTLACGAEGASDNNALALSPTSSSAQGVCMAWGTLHSPDAVALGVLAPRTLACGAEGASDNNALALSPTSSAQGVCMAWGTLAISRLKTSKVTNPSDDHRVHIWVNPTHRRRRPKSFPALPA